MRMTNRLFTYPVLTAEKDDYKESIFQVEYVQTMDGVNTLKIVFDIAMSNLDIEKLILNGQAEYVIHLECSTTAYRQVVRSFEKHIEHKIPIGRINGSLEIIAFVIVKKDLKGFVSSDWDEDYEGKSFDLTEGSILAYQNVAEFDISKDINEFASGNSIFTVYRRLTETDVPFEVGLESNTIRIGLGTRDYDVYTNYSSRSELQHIINSMIILPSLVYVFEELKQEDGMDLYHGRGWFMALEKSYASRGLDFIEEVQSDKNSILLAQEAMEYPISKAFAQIPLLFSYVDEEDE